MTTRMAFWTTSEKQGQGRSGPKGALFPVLLAVAVVIAAAPAVAQDVAGARGTPTYHNTWFTADPVDPDVEEAESTLFVGGRVRAPEYPDDGVDLSIASFGQPFETKILRPPDFYIGGEIDLAALTPPQGATGDPEITPATLPKVFKIEFVEGDRYYALEAGFIEVEWTGGAAQYLISSEGAHTPMKVYWTEGSDDGPPVALEDASGIEIFYSENLAPIDGGVVGLDPNDPDDTYYLWPSQEAGTVLRAEGKEGHAVIAFHGQSSPPWEYANFTGVQVVDVVKYLGDSLQYFDIGQQITPVTEAPVGYEAIPHVSRGQSDFIYQHNVAGPKEGTVYAIKTTLHPQGVESEVFWMRKSDAPGVSTLLPNIDWPYEQARYTSDWPIWQNAQLYVRGAPDHLGPAVPIPAQWELNPHLMNFQLSLEVDTGKQATFQSNQFDAKGRCWALMRYTPGSDVVFQVIRVVRNTAPAFFGGDLIPANNPADIGDEVTDAYHEPKDTPGYLHVVAGWQGSPRDEQYDAAVYDVGGGGTGQIFPVNVGELEVWWYNEFEVESHAIAWPSWVKRYDVDWPDPPDRVIEVDSQIGADSIPHPAFEIYYQNTKNQPGFNPNDEHALIGASKKGGEKANTVYALRDDLGAAATSQPYVLIKYEVGEAPDPVLWEFDVFQVTRGDLIHEPVLNVGSLLQAPFPLGVPPLGNASATLNEDLKVVFHAGRTHTDRKSNVWFKAAADDGSNAIVRVDYSYKNLPQPPYAFYWPLNEPEFAGLFDYPGGAPVENTWVPWLDEGLGNPPDYTLEVQWPAPEIVIKHADTIVENIDGNLSVKILYQQSLALSQGESLKLIDYRAPRSVPMDPPIDFGILSLPDMDDQAPTYGQYKLVDLPPGVKDRVRWYQDQLLFWGDYIDPPGVVLSNVLGAESSDEMKALRELSEDPDYQQAVTDLQVAASDIVEITDYGATLDVWGYAITTGLAPLSASGFVTLIMADHPFLGAEGADPVSLKVVKVESGLAKGRVLTILPDCPFDERIFFKHSGDFAGHPENYTFEWQVRAATPGSPPPWDPWNVPPFEQVSVTVSGPGVFTLRDNEFRCRYEKNTDPGTWSSWTDEALGEGWIKRVIGDFGPYRQRASGGGIAGAESDMLDEWATREVNSIISMIEQAGDRWEGNVPLNCSADVVDSLGLIEVYDTVLNRGKMLSIDFGLDYGPANDALLLAAGRLADLYMLLGNEAYADASDPTIGYGTSHGVYGSVATAIHTFMNQVDSPISEELALLYGRDDSRQPNVRHGPLYNRIGWNYTGGGGEVAYNLNYNIVDRTNEGIIDELDAAIMWPQGHGDAWGHYLTAIKKYYILLRHPYYSWVPRSELVAVGAESYEVDYYDERKFAAAAAARARSGAEIVNLKYRNDYVDDPGGQWQGYYDEDPDRAWGVSEWGGRAGMGAYFDWVVGNAILPANDIIHEGIRKIDRGTVTELREMPGAFEDVQAQVDMADAGLNPLGLAKNVVPFDISPGGIDQGETHFEQIFSRAVQAMQHAIAVFDHANNFTQALRSQADAESSFHDAAEDREQDLKNRLIEAFGYPYNYDVGPGNLYDNGGVPDLFHYMMHDPADVIGEFDSASTELPPIEFHEMVVDADGVQSDTVKQVTFHISDDGYGVVIPPEWPTEPPAQRRAPGEIQMAQGELLQARVRFERTMADYDNHIEQIEDMAALIEAQYGVNAEEIRILNDASQQQQSLNDAVRSARASQINMAGAAHMVTVVANGAAEALPTVVGLANDATSAARSAIRLGVTAATEALNLSAENQAVAELQHQQAKEAVAQQTNISLTALRGEQAIRHLLAQLEQMVRAEVSLRLDVFTQQESMQQAARRYSATLAKGQRLLEERARFRARTAANVQKLRYKDMAFRIFRNDALQKYRAMFDLAARYVYLAAKAYDYETNLLGADTQAGQQFLTDIVKARSLGQFESGFPITGGNFSFGLADPMAQMWFNFDQNLRGELGFNNPQTETNRFSLRSELLRIKAGAGSGDLWRQTLEQSIVPDLQQLPEFRRYCVSPFVDDTPQPAIVLPFDTVVNEGLNFFGWPLSGGDSAYDATNFATKIRSVGVWFSNYNNLDMSNNPRIYLIPVGNDVMLSPTAGRPVTREWQLIDQNLPTPFLNTGALDDAEWIPFFDALDTGGGFAAVRKFNRFRAYHDSGTFNVNEVVSNSRLVGRSVWNTRWLLIIPGSQILSNPEEGLLRFIHGKEIGGERTGDGVTDIKVFFQTYAYTRVIKGSEEN